MVTTYTVLKTIHILAVAIWVGGGVLITTLIARARRASDSVTLVALIRQVQFVGPRVFAPSSLIALVTGVWLVLDGDLDWSLWVILGLVGWAATFVTGNFFLEPAGKKLGAVLAERGPEDPDAQAYVTRILNVARVDQVVLILVIVDMVIKPT
ncbi:MAG TPA: DUF2269 family protein [Thermoleophilaceae bacterium]|nr:DUF2269 family protein [Thermoleophilaceae bacterium]